jgi:hypothetical protein
VCQTDRSVLRVRVGGSGYARVMTEEPRRAPDPFRPAEVPEGRPFGKAGRPVTPMLVVGAIVLVVLAIVLIAVAR